MHKRLLRALGGVHGLSLWIALAVALVYGIWLAVSWWRHRSLPGIGLPPGAPDGTLPEPDCMVVIPARDEEDNIARAVRSLPPDTVIVVDDHSRDRTAEVARQAGAGVLAAPPVPSGGLGKANACDFGARALVSRWVLFTDADTWFEPGFLNAAVRFAETQGLALLSLYLQPECATAAERILIPYIRALFFCGVSPKSAAMEHFTGQCLLVRRDPYVFAGGHGAVASHLADGMKLAALARRHQLKLAVARATVLGHARMYAGLDGLRSGIERHAFRFMLINPWAGAAILFAAAWMALWLPVLAWLTVERAWIAAGAFAVLPVVLLRPWYGSWTQAVAAPLAIYRTLPLLARGAVSAVTGRRIEWKGRKIRVVS